MQSIPPPPGAPDEETAARWKSQATMLILLTEDYGDDPNDVVNGWMQQHLGVAADMVGPPDVSANTLLDAAGTGPRCRSSRKTFSASGIGF